MATIHEIERFLRKHDIPPTRFGRDTVNDANLVARMRCDTKISGDRMAKIDAYMAGYAAAAAPKRPTVLAGYAPIKEPPIGLENEVRERAAMTQFSRALLRALWKSHAGILAYLGADRLERN